MIYFCVTVNEDSRKISRSVVALLQIFRVQHVLKLQWLPVETRSDCSSDTATEERKLRFTSWMERAIHRIPIAISSSTFLPLPLIFLFAPLAFPVLSRDAASFFFFSRSLNNVVLCNVYWFLFTNPRDWSWKKKYLLRFYDWTRNPKMGFYSL